MSKSFFYCLCCLFFPAWILPCLEHGLMTQNLSLIFGISRASDAISYCQEIMKALMENMFPKWLMQQAIYRYDSMKQLVSFCIFIY